MNILHLSDIHFGRDKSNSTDHFERKSEILDKLINTLGSLDEDMKPDLVLVTGDIAWTGKISEFDEAYEWFRRLKTALNLGDGSFVFCPGNHDLNRNTAMNFQEEVLWKQEGGKEKRKWLSYHGNLQQENNHLCCNRKSYGLSQDYMAYKRSCCIDPSTTISCGQYFYR